MTDNSNTKVDLRPNVKGFDPDSWDEMRALGHRVLDDMMDELENIRSRPSWQSITDESIDVLSAPLPQEGQGFAAAYEGFKTYIEPYLLGNHTARHWGWANGAGTPEGVLSGLIMHTFNVNTCVHRQSGIYVEMQVVEWLKEVYGYGPDAGGVLTTGGSMANLYGLAAARFAKLGEAAQDHGVNPSRDGVKGYTVYATEETHYSIAKSWDILGLGRKNCRAVALDDARRMDMEALRAAVAEDRANGYMPLAIAATLVTVGTGAIDPLEEIADFAAAEGLWFHIDAAIGCGLSWSDKYQDLCRGLERADSFAFDLHKWLQQPYAAGAVLIKDAAHLRGAFAFPAPYIANIEGTLPDAPMKTSDYGMELSRDFRGLHLWMSLQMRGRKAYGDMVDASIAHVQYLKGLIADAPNLEQVGPAPLNIINFRYLARGEDGQPLAEEALTRLNQELYRRLTLAGIASPSTYSMEGKFTIRVCNVSHRTRSEDFDDLVEACERIGAEIIDEGAF